MKVKIINAKTTQELIDAVRIAAAFEGKTISAFVHDTLSADQRVKKHLKKGLVKR